MLYLLLHVLLVPLHAMTLYPDPQRNRDYARVPDHGTEAFSVTAVGKAPPKFRGVPALDMRMMFSLGQDLSQFSHLFSPREEPVHHLNSIFCARYMVASQLTTHYLMTCTPSYPQTFRHFVLSPSGLQWW